jgi:plasmid stabilization system protein ParE
VKRRVRILPAAQSDADVIFDWLSERSPQGAESWATAFKAAVADLADNADRHASASEAKRIKRPLRQAFFKTGYGKRYRLILFLTEDEVRILRVRAPGQRPLRNTDLE